MLREANLLKKKLEDIKCPCKTEIDYIVLEKVDKKTAKEIADRTHRLNPNEEVKIPINPPERPALNVNPCHSCNKIKPQRELVRNQCQHDICTGCIVR